MTPPFNSNRDYNLLFKEQSGAEAEALIKAFEDTWHWDASARDTFDDLTGAAVNEGRVPEQVARLLDSLVRGIGHNDMSAYLVMMTPRLVQLHRVLKRTGSLYLHCDPTASHYLKIVLDSIFGPERFLNEITWKRTTAHNDPQRYGRIQDRLLYYSKSAKKTFNRVFGEYSDEQLSRYKYADDQGPFRAENLTAPHFSKTRTVEWRGVHPGADRQWRFSKDELDRLYEDGRILLQRDGRPRKDGYKVYLSEAKGPALQDIWTDIALAPTARERLGYPTQKPLALLERILATSTNEGDIVLDPFCGCGTALIAAEKLKRKWIGIDVTHLSIAVMRSRLMDSFGMADVPVLGVPEDIQSARLLAAESKDGRYEFQWWALARIDAKPLGGERKKGADRGIDGVMTFSEHDSIQRILVSVKSGKPSLLHVKELMATLDTESGAIGVLLELDEPTSETTRAALEAGQYESELWSAKFDRIQILTVAELLAGKKPDVPKFMPAYQKAARIAAEAGQQQALWESAQGE